MAQPYQGLYTELGVAELLKGLQRVELLKKIEGKLLSILRTRTMCCYVHAIVHGMLLTCMSTSDALMHVANPIND